MIAVRGSFVALLGGWRGDRLWLSRSGGLFFPLAELGWDEARQTTPQRRLRLVEGACFVLEPTEGPRLDGPVQVRRIELSGEETGREAGADEVPEPWSTDWLYFRAYARKPGALSLDLRGIEPATGRAVTWRGEVETGIRGPREPCSGIPLLLDSRIHLPLRAIGMLVLGRDDARLWSGTASIPASIAGRGACAAGVVGGAAGIWIEGSWQPLEGPPAFGGARIPLSPLVAAHGDGGVAMLRRRGGELGVIGGPSAKLPDGRYLGLVRLPEGLFGVAEGETPALVAAVL